MPTLNIFVDEFSRKRRRRESGGSDAAKDEIGEKLSELISSVGEKVNLLLVATF